MLKIKNYAIDADGYCYIIGELKTRKTKSGEMQEYIYNPKYYGKLEDAFKAILDAEHRKTLVDNEGELKDFLANIKAINKEFCELFKKAVCADESN